MRQPCAVFLDWDGTLSQGDGPPSAADLAALARLRERGHLLCLCTGRTTGYFNDYS